MEFEEKDFHLIRSHITITKNFSKHISQFLFSGFVNGISQNNTHRQSKIFSRSNVKGQLE